MNLRAVRASEKAQTLLSTNPWALAAAITSVSFSFAALPFSDTTHSAPRSARRGTRAPMAASSSALSAP